MRERERERESPQSNTVVVGYKRDISLVGVGCWLPDVRVLVQQGLIVAIGLVIALGLHELEVR